MRVLFLLCVLVSGTAWADVAEDIAILEKRVTWLEARNDRLTGMVESLIGTERAKRAYAEFLANDEKTGDDVAVDSEDLHREWNLNNGEKFMAAFIGYSKGEVALQLDDGSIKRVLVKNMSEKDREWVEKQARVNVKKAVEPPQAVVVDCPHCHKGRVIRPPADVPPGERSQIIMEGGFPVAGTNNNAGRTWKCSVCQGRGTLVRTE